MSIAGLNLDFPITDPTWIFLIVLVIILFAPLLLNRLKIPHIIGLIIAGMVFGPHGLNVLAKDQSFELFGEVGILYIMFQSGLEVDMNTFRQNSKKGILFGLYTFFLPMIIGTVTSMYILNFDFVTSVLLSSMYASHTLIAYPIVSKMGIAKHRAISITVVGTIITVVGALLVLAVIVARATGEMSAGYWGKFGVGTVIFGIVVFWLIPYITKLFLKLNSDNVAQYIFVLAMVFFASWLAAIVGLEGIIGAFFAGLVLNRLIPSVSPLMNRIEFFGNAFFIPFFLISVGILLDLGVLLEDYHPLMIAIVLSVSAFFGKWAAAWITQLIYKFSKYQRRLVFGLSSSHAAATLAIILAGYNAGILDENILNGTIILILITCMMASFVTEKAAKQIVLNENNETDLTVQPVTTDKILIPVANIANLEPLLDLAILMKERKSTSPVIIMSVVPDNEQAEINIMKASNKLQHFVKLGSSAEVDVKITATIDHSISGGIVRMARVTAATTLMLGWPGKLVGMIDRFFGSDIMKIVNNTDKAVYVCSFDRPLIDVRRILLMTTPYAEVEVGFESWVNKIALLSSELNVPVVHYGLEHTALCINNILKNKRMSVSFSSVPYSDWDNFSNMASFISKDDLIVVVSSRQGFPSYLKRFDIITDKLTESYRKNAKIAVYPQQNHENSMIDET